MQLQKLHKIGSLVYFNNGEEKLSIHETKHFRWLSFGETVQSVMNRAKPAQLTMPHQQVMLLPLILFKPRHICEIGLGGGNTSRFMASLTSEVSFSSIESSAIVRDCFNIYFNPNNSPLNTIDANCDHQFNEDFRSDVDWWMIDIFNSASHAQKEVEGCHKLSYFNAILSALAKNNAILSINIPNGAASDLTPIMEDFNRLTNVESSHYTRWFKVPNYQNIIVHLIPKKISNKDESIQNKSYLKKGQIARWSHHWKSGYSI